MKFQIESPESEYPMLEVIQATQVVDYPLEIKFSDRKKIK